MYYHTLNEELRRRFGCKVYKLALDGGFTCPNRDGTIGARGCIFCAGDGSGTFAADRALDIPQQIEAAKVRVAGKNGGGKYIAYFQNFTNTYGSLARMERLFTQALAPEDVVALSVATRPDCLPDAVIALLQRLNTEKPVWVELGLQTIHPQSAAYIRRGYDLPVFDDAVRRLRAAGLEVIVHQILGLPGRRMRRWCRPLATSVRAGHRASSCTCCMCCAARIWRQIMLPGSSRCSRRSTISTCSSSVCAYSHRRWSSTA
ncbi:MAG: TIGR01212 family radical SAM protein [Oscillospiraceae bacterium]